MFKYKSIKTAYLKELKKNEKLNAELIKQRADIDYISMMADVELEVKSVGGTKIE